jgi:hypothetical protein
MCVSNCTVSSILQTETSSGKVHTGRMAALLVTSQQTLHCRWFDSPHPSAIIRHVSTEDSAPSSSFTNLPPSHLNFSLWCAPLSPFHRCTGKLQASVIQFRRTFELAAGYYDTSYNISERCNNLWHTQCGPKVLGLFFLIEDAWGRNILFNSK